MAGWFVKLLSCFGFLCRQPDDTSDDLRNDKPEDATSTTSSYSSSNVLSESTPVLLVSKNHVVKEFFANFYIVSNSLDEITTQLKSLSDKNGVHHCKQVRRKLMDLIPADDFSSGAVYDTIRLPFWSSGYYFGRILKAIHHEESHFSFAVNQLLRVYVEQVKSIIFNDSLFGVDSLNFYNQLQIFAILKKNFDSNKARINLIANILKESVWFKDLSKRIRALSEKSGVCDLAAAEEEQCDDDTLTCDELGKLLQIVNYIEKKGNLIRSLKIIVETMRKKPHTRAFLISCATIRDGAIGIETSLSA